MCMTLNGKRPAIMSSTITGSLEVRDPNGGVNDALHVIFYQNSQGQPSAAPPQRRRIGSSRSTMPSLTAPRRRSGSPAPDHWGESELTELGAQGDALVIPLLTNSFDSIVGLTLPDTFLQDIHNAVKPDEPVSFGGAGRGPTRRNGAPKVKHVQIGPYHVVLAEEAHLVAKAVKDVDYLKRPDLNQAVCDSLQADYDCPFAVCCFNPDELVRSSPIGFAFQPKYKDKLFVYTTEAHGEVPNYDEYVQRDHTLFVGSHRMPAGTGHDIDWSGNGLSKSVRPYALDQVCGFTCKETTINGDLVFSLPKLRKGTVQGSWVTPPKVTPSAGRAKVLVNVDGSGFYNEVGGGK